MNDEKKRPLIPVKIVCDTSNKMALEAVPLIRARLQATGKKKLTRKEFHDILRHLAKKHTVAHGIKINFKVLFNKVAMLLYFYLKEDARK